MSEFQKVWKSTGGQIGKASQMLVEYETKENGRNTRYFDGTEEYDQWCQEMGENIKVIAVRKGGENLPLLKSFIVRVNGEDHGCWDEEKEAKAYLQMLREGGTFGVLIEQTVVGQTQKGVIAKDKLLQKPGGSTHTAKWDRCVAHVKSNNPDADPYAVCTAMLGDESFKAMDEVQFNGIIDKALDELTKSPAAGVGSFGIAGAGPIPHSLLARQDLEGTTKKASIGGFSSQSELIARMKGNQKAPVAKGGSFKDAWSRIKPR